MLVADLEASVDRVNKVRSAGHTLSNDSQAASRIELAIWLHNNSAKITACSKPGYKCPHHSFLRRLAGALCIWLRELVALSASRFLWKLRLPVTRHCR